MFLYGLLVVAVVPIVLGSLLGAVLRSVEERPGPSPWWGRMLGAGDPPLAWDRLPSHLGDGGYVVVRRKGETFLVGGKMSRNSHLSLSPSAHDLLIEEVWWLDTHGNPVAPVEPRRAAWVGGGEIDFLHVIPKEAVEPVE